MVVTCPPSFSVITILDPLRLMSGALSPYAAVNPSTTSIRILALLSSERLFRLVFPVLVSSDLIIPLTLLICEITAEAVLSFTLCSDR